MIKIENTQVYGWEAALRGMRNPKNSWDKADSTFNPIQIGPNDLRLAVNLANAGSDHGKYLRMITVTADISSALYWYKEFDTYKVGTVADSCSTMHKIHAKEFTLDDFAHEHLSGTYLKSLESTIELLNDARYDFNLTKDKAAWWQMIQLLPSSYIQKRTVQLNYAVLRNMYRSRKDHKLDEWHEFCDWIRSLPYAAELIIGGEE